MNAHGVGELIVMRIASEKGRERLLRLLRKGVMPMRVAETLPYLALYPNKPVALALWEGFSVGFLTPNFTVWSKGVGGNLVSTLCRPKVLSEKVA